MILLKYNLKGGFYEKNQFYCFSIVPCGNA